MLSEHEQRVWDDIERMWAAEARKPVRARVNRAPDAPGLEDMPAAVAAGAWIMIMLILFGAVTAGLAVGGATAFGWLLWRWSSPSASGDRASASPTDDETATPTE